MSDWKPCWSCGSENVGPTGGMRIIMCGDCGAGPEEERIWRARALGPALDVVLAELDNRKEPLWDRLSDGSRVPIGVKSLAHCLRLLRDAHSPTDTPSGSGAQSDTGEAERGS